MRISLTKRNQLKKMTNEYDLEELMRREEGRFSIKYGDLKLEITLSKGRVESRLLLLNQGEDISITLVDRKYSQSGDSGQIAEIGVDTDEIDTYGQRMLDYFSDIEKVLTTPDLHRSVGDVAQASYLIPKNQFESFKSEMKWAAFWITLIRSKVRYTPRKYFQEVQTRIENISALLSIIMEYATYSANAIRESTQLLPQENPEKMQYEKVADYYGKLAGLAKRILQRGSNVTGGIIQVGDLMGYENLQNKNKPQIPIKAPELPQ